MHVLLGSTEEKVDLTIAYFVSLGVCQDHCMRSSLTEGYSVQSTLLLKITLTVRLILRSLWLM